MSCRDEILAALSRILAADKTTFTIDEVIDSMRLHGTKYSPSTISTHIGSRMCANAPDNHATTYKDLIRVGPGRYALFNGQSPVELFAKPPEAAAPRAVTGATQEATLVGTLDATPQLMKYTLFEERARKVMESRFGIPLAAGSVHGIPKKFDFVARDGSVIGDAKFYTRVGGIALPPAKYATIAEYVWLLEKTNATHRFLIFGNDIEVPRGWLKKYGALSPEVKFFFLHDNLDLEELKKART